MISIQENILSTIQTRHTLYQVNHKNIQELDNDITKFNTVCLVKIHHILY